LSMATGTDCLPRCPQWLTTRDEAVTPSEPRPSVHAQSGKGLPH
jgi:hypothetical protein